MADRLSPWSALPHGSETVLVADDVDLVRNFVSDALGLLGYRVVAVSGGSEALAALEGRESSIDLLLTDVLMRDVDGRDLARRALEFRPGIRVLFMSGWLARADGGGADLPAGAQLLSKPFTIDVLAHAVRRALDEPPAS